MTRESLAIRHDMGLAGGLAGTAMEADLVPTNEMQAVFVTAVLAAVAV